MTILPLAGEIKRGAKMVINPTLQAEWYKWIYIQPRLIPIGLNVN